MVYELRVYEAPPGKLQRLHERFANHATRSFKKHGMQAIGFWTDDIGASNQLTSILAFQDLGDRERKWAAFRADLEWTKAMAESERDGPLVARLISTIMRPTASSPLQ